MSALGQIQTFGIAQELPNYFVMIGRVGAAGGALSGTVKPNVPYFCDEVLPRLVRAGVRVKHCMAA
jgi:hypothetical protein